MDSSFLALLRSATPWLVALATGLLPAGRADAADKSGVSPDRIRLPKGPGSLEGTGENVEPNLSMGLMTYRVAVSVPEGYPGLTPDLSLVYNSGAGNSPIGIGWSLPVPAIERMTSRGLPRYTAADVFAANGSDELVRVSGDTFRARFEKGFVRYTFVDSAGDGREGYWTAEYPDGRTGYFGATSAGRLVAAARDPGAGGTHRYHLVEVVDPFDHHLVYGYGKDGLASRLERVEYVFRGSEPDYEVVLSYEARPDPLSDAKSGVELSFSERLRGISVNVRGSRLRNYELRYESEATSGGFSRLSRVRWFGTNDDAGPFPAVFTFGYSAALGASTPRLVEMGGALDVDLSAGTADLVDMNSDGLPDVVDTAGGVHRVFVNELPETGSQRFADPVDSSVGSLELVSPNTELFDLDGDGLSEMVDPEAGVVLRQRGTGLWFEEQAFDGLGMPNLSENANLRFLDWDGDKLTDIFMADPDAPAVYANRGPTGFEIVDAGLDPLGTSFSSANLEFSDMNGDGLLDLVRKAAGVVEYRMNLGFGRWTPDSAETPGGWISMQDVPASFSGSALDGSERLVDLNGDGQSDLVSVVADDVRYAINRNGRGFDDEVSLRATSDLEIPERTAEVSFRFADMNGSGSTDIVYFAGGSVSYVELFPERPNLLTSVSNGLGKVIQIDYGSSTEHLQRDGGADAWELRLPHPMLTVDEIVVRDDLSQVEERQSFHYSNGFYDGEERQFRGFRNAVVETPGGRGVEAGIVRHVFDVGVDDRYRKGLPLGEETESDGEALSATEYEYDDECSLSDVGEPTVRFVCPLAVTRIVKERGDSPSDWVTVREEYAYEDGYGNRTETRKLGVVQRGEGACEPCDRGEGVFGAPCGESCTGDESFESTSFAPPPEGGRWILNKPAVRRVRGEEGSATFSEESFYYDGDAFEGLPNRELERGLVSRVQVKAYEAPAEYYDRERFAYNADGAVVEARDANGHRRTFGYDPTSLRVEEETLWFDDRAEPYGLRMTAAYDPVFDTVVSASSWMRVEGEDAVTPARETRFRWDSFARLEASARPGDDIDASPTEVYDYSGIQAPVSRIVRRSRSESGGELDLEEVQCFDGLGRKLQTRTLVEPGLYQVSGFTEFNLRSQAWKTYQPFTAPGDACDESSASLGTARFSETSYDATNRSLSVFEPDDDVDYGRSARRSESRNVYEPLRTVAYDAEDTDDESPHYDTPTATVTDGLGRTVRHERTLSSTDDEGERAVRSVPIELTYDALGNLRGYRQAHAGGVIEKIQTYDLVGRVSRVDDPDSGTTLFDHDFVGNVVRETDARGIATRSLYDEANRLVRQWEDGRQDETTIGYDYDLATDCERCTNVEGQLARVTFPTNDDGSERGEDAIGYDERSQAVYARRLHDGHVFEIETELDNVGRVVGRRYPTGHHVAMTLDGAGRIVSVPGYVDAVGYEGRGLLESVTYANGVTTGYAYDSLARLSSLDAASENTAIQAYSYPLRDRAGNILRIQDAGDLGDAPSAAAEHAYDDWYRLVESRLDTDRDAEEILNVAYDDIDNILSKTSSLDASPDHVGDYLYSGDDAGPHAVTEAGDLSLRYDLAGNMTSHGDDEYRWDFLGRMQSAHRGDRVLGSYAYGPDRTRIRKDEDGHLTYYVAPDFEVRDGTAVIYITLGDRKVVKLEIPEYAASFLADLAPGTRSGNEFTPDPDGVVTAGDAWIAQMLVNGEYTADVEVEVDDGLVDELLAASTRRMLGVSTETVTYLHHNHLGTTVATTNADGEVLHRTEHYPYGMVRYQSEGFGEEYGYTGKERDDGNALGYFGARFYSARLGRWTATDPLSARTNGSGVQLLTYGFVRGNPLNLTDPTGLLEKSAEASGGFGFNWKLGKEKSISLKVGPSTDGSWEAKFEVSLPKGKMGVAYTNYAENDSEGRQQAFEIIASPAEKDLSRATKAGKLRGSLESSIRLETFDDRMRLTTSLSASLEAAKKMGNQWIRTSVGLTGSVKGSGIYEIRQSGSQIALNISSKFEGSLGGEAVAYRPAAGGLETMKGGSFKFSGTGNGSEYSKVLYDAREE